MDAANEAFLDGFREHTMEGVREYAEGYPVELRRDVRTGRWMVTAFAECQNRITQVDLFDLFDWLAVGPPSGRVEGGFVLHGR